MSVCHHVDQFAGDNHNLAYGQSLKMTSNIGFRQSCLLNSLLVCGSGNLYLATQFAIDLDNNSKQIPFECLW